MEELFRVAEEYGIDVEDVLINAIRNKSGDPSETIRLRLELAKKYMAESREYLGRGDAVQASEKAYKAVGECIKALVEKYNLPEHQQAMKEGKWYTHQLSSAANKLTKLLGDWVVNGWSSAYVLHVWGFHEAKLSVSDITEYINKVERMVNEAEKALAFK
jgi:hypothetical protein